LSFILSCLFCFRLALFTPRSVCPMERRWRATFPPTPNSASFSR
jgi:hypothetical protein